MRNPQTLETIQSFTEAQKTLLSDFNILRHPSTLQRTLSRRLTSRFTWTLSDLQWPIKAPTHVHPNVVLTHPFTGVTSDLTRSRVHTSSSIDQSSKLRGSSPKVLV
ncbi:hypothetical protein TNCV_1117811 [Trichonephila clavipes]|nr:hypothetical protein TNCV_1117811 [Trichonephila clavipes]